MFILLVIKDTCFFAWFLKIRREKILIRKQFSVRRMQLRFKINTAAACSEGSRLVQIWRWQRWVIPLRTRFEKTIFNNLDLPFWCKEIKFITRINKTPLFPWKQRQTGYQISILHSKLIANVRNTYIDHRKSRHYICCYGKRHTNTTRLLAKYTTNPFLFFVKRK